jgi:hypothetical protein
MSTIIICGNKSEEPCYYYDNGKCKCTEDCDFKLYKQSNEAFPTLLRMKELEDESQKLGEFFEWLQSKYCIFDKRVGRDEPVFREAVDYIDIEKLLADYFNIDLKEAEKERLQILEVERNKHKEHHCIACGTYIEEDNLRVCNKCASEIKF